MAGPAAPDVRAEAGEACGNLGRMAAVEVLFTIGWAGFWIYWLSAAFFTKRGRIMWGRELAVRAVLFVVAVLLIRVGAFRHPQLHTSAWRAGLGVVLFAAGLTFAIWSGRASISDATGAAR